MQSTVAEKSRVEMRTVCNEIKSTCCYGNNLSCDGKMSEINYSPL